MPSCLLPIFIAGLWKEAASTMPLDELPMTNKQYFKDEVVRVSNTYMSADGTTTAETPKPANWDSTKTQNWLTGLTTGFNVFRPVQQPTGNPYLGMGNNAGGGAPPPPGPHAPWANKTTKIKRAFLCFA